MRRCAVGLNGLTIFQLAAIETNRLSPARYHFAVLELNHLVLEKLVIRNWKIFALMRAAALSSRYRRTDHRFGGREHRAQFESILYIEIELALGADPKMKQIFSLHLFDACQRRRQFVSSPK